MQHSFAGELSLQQALRHFPDLVPGSLNRDGGPQFLLGYHLGELCQIFRILFSVHCAKCRSPLEAVVQDMAKAIPVRPDFIRQLQAVIDLNAELQERELLKMASLTAVLAEALRQRGISPSTAMLLAETGIVVFRVAFDRWIAVTGERTLSQVV